MWSSAAVAHLLQGSTCCVFRDGILQILVVTSGYLSYCCLSIISNQSAHSPLTSDINKAFSSTQLPLTALPTNLAFTFTFMHLADAFIQSYLQLHSGYTFFVSICVPWESNPQPFALLTQCSTTEPHRNTIHTITILHLSGDDNLM